MPLYKEWEIGDHGLAAIWKIEEPESYFYDRTGISPDIKHDKRRIEHLAGRFLLRYLKEDFPLHSIYKDEHDKPRLENNEFFFSISHSWPYVAAIIDPYMEAGIDIQSWHPNIDRIKNKFLSLQEQEMLNHDPKLITLSWSAKEAAYKWNGRRGVDFIAHLPISRLAYADNFINIEINSITKGVSAKISLKSFTDKDFSCAYVVFDASQAI